MARNHIRSLINHANALKSTGPRTREGKQRSRMNAFKHNLSGQHLVLVEHEFDAYREACERGLRDLKPKTEPERQIAQKIIDINFRLNRITALETNMFNLDTMDHTTRVQRDDRVEVMQAQTRAWKTDAHAFDLLGRYESRLSRQLLQYHKELERLQTIRKAEEKVAEAEQNALVENEMASFGNPVPPMIMRKATGHADSIRMPSPDRSEAAGTNSLSLASRSVKSEPCPSAVPITLKL